MTSFISDVLQLVSDFLWAEPIRYFVGLALIVFVAHVISSIFSISRSRY